MYVGYTFFSIFALKSKSDILFCLKNKKKVYRGGVAERWQGPEGPGRGRGP
jgi:hypothetical protein